MIMIRLLLKRKGKTILESCIYFITGCSWLKTKYETQNTCIAKVYTVMDLNKETVFRCFWFEGHLGGPNVQGKRLTYY